MEERVKEKGKNKEVAHAVHKALRLELEALGTVYPLYRYEQEHVEVWHAALQKSQALVSSEGSPRRQALVLGHHSFWRTGQCSPL
jgi:hypothetical protein